jgi:hypothetical protein
VNPRTRRVVLWVLGILSFAAATYGWIWLMGTGAP